MNIVITIGAIRKSDGITLKPTPCACVVMRQRNRRESGKNDECKQDGQWPGSCHGLHLHCISDAPLGVDCFAWNARHSARVATPKPTTKPVVPTVNDRRGSCAVWRWGCLSLQRSRMRTGCVTMFLVASHRPTPWPVRASRGVLSNPAAGGSTQFRSKLVTFPFWKMEKS